MSSKRICPECGKELIYKTHGVNSIYFCKYCRGEWKFDINVSSATKFQWRTNCPKCNVPVLITKNEGLRKITCSCNETWRFDSDKGEHLPDAKRYGDNILVTCPECGRKSRVPDRDINLMITCGRCSHKFYISGNTQTQAVNEPVKSSYRATASVNQTTKASQSAKASPKATWSVNSDANETKKASFFKNTTANKTDSYNTNTSNQTTSQTGFFEGIKNFFTERKEAAEAEEIFIGDSPLTHYIGDVLLNTLNELRSQLQGCSSKDYFELHVEKTYCDLTFYAYDFAENKYKHGKLVIRCEYKKIQNLFQWSNGYTEIKSRKARKWFREVVYHEHMLNCGYILRPDYDRRFGILKSQL